MIPHDPNRGSAPQRRPTSGRSPAASASTQARRPCGTWAPAGQQQNPARARTWACPRPGAPYLPDMAGQYLDRRRAYGCTDRRVFAQLLAGLASYLESVLPTDPSAQPEFLCTAVRPRQAG